MPQTSKRGKGCFEVADKVLDVSLQPVSLLASWQRALAECPDLLQLKQDVAKADVDLKYRRKPTVPLVGLGGRLWTSRCQHREGAPDGGPI